VIQTPQVSSIGRTPVLRTSVRTIGREILVQLQNLRHGECVMDEHKDQANKVRCHYCKGRGWHVGDCHPCETCGVCDGTGVLPTDYVPEVPAKLIFPSF